MTRLEHFIRGNGLALSDIAEWATMKELRIQALIDGGEWRIHDACRLVASCSYLLGRRVRLAELFNVDETP